MEIWKSVKGYEGIYQVSNFGRVRNCNNGCILKSHKERKGYLRVGLSKGAKQTAHYVHQLVAKAFIPNPDALPQVNHKDEIPSNNNADNLEWCDNKYNCNYGLRSKRISDAMSKRVYQYDKKLHFIRSWASAREPEQYGFNHAHIASCCRNERKTHKSYIWSYSPIYALLRKHDILPLIEQEILV